jgi:hypothetical protein
MIAGAILVAGGLTLAGYCITATGPILLGAGPLIAVGLVLYGFRLWNINRARRAIARRRRRRGGFIA